MRPTCCGVRLTWRAAAATAGLLLLAACGNGPEGQQLAGADGATSTTLGTDATSTTGSLAHADDPTTTSSQGPSSTASTTRTIRKPVSTTTVTTPHPATTTSVPGITSTTAPPAPPRLAYTAAGPGGRSYELKIWDFATGTSRKLATNVSFYPSWSPDGRYLAFGDQYGVNYADTVTGQLHFYVSPGTPPATDRAEWPSWSPDGTRIAYLKTGQLWVMNADGGQQRALTSVGTRGYLPSWSPDAQRIAFTASTPSGYRIFTIGADGSGLTNVTADRANGERPNWSPDGRWIAFIADVPSPGPGSGLLTGGVYLVRPDGSELHRVGTGSTTDVSWSPDSLAIAYAMNGDPPAAGVHVVEVSTGAERILTSGADSVTWAPDGSFMVFAGDCGSESSDLCRLNGDNGATSRITDYAGGRPVFAPR